MKQIEIYDIEVYKYDWFLVARRPEETEYTVIHNDSFKLKKYLRSKNLLIGGFNNKHYDDGIIHAIYHGADNAIVKEMNDFIIEKKKLWFEFPFVNFKKKVFDSFDLRDDLPINLSLKAIEGNLGRAIVETSVPFDIDRPLTAAEIEEVIAYCKVDVDYTVELYHKREPYIAGKKQVARIKGIDEMKAMGLTNAKLTALFLDAKKQVRHDEFDYPIPNTLDIGRYKEVLEYFKEPLEFTLKAYQTRHDEAKTPRQQKTWSNRIAKLEESSNPYDTKLETEIAGVKHTLAWGGIHGALTKYVDQADEEYNIVLVDVRSYYPSMMIEYEYISRNVPSVQGFADVYQKRMHAKATGDKETSNALKLVLNTTYGAMKNQYNDLYDPRNANAICVGGQLLLTDLIDKLEDVKGFKLIQSNTDGILFKYKRSIEPRVFEIIEAWEKRTRMNMEYTDILSIAQKDVNNYVMKMGEVYLVKNGVKKIEKENKGYIETKGGYVSLYGGGDFRNKNLVVTHEALVNYFMNGIPVEDNINKETDVTKFQIIAKTGSTYSGTFHEVDGKKVDVQNVNRVYATNNKKYGTVKKVKANGREDKIAGLPDHAIIDNLGEMTLDDIDKSFYIELAKDRIVDYVGKKNASKQLKLQIEEDHDSMTTKTLNIYQKINAIRLDFEAKNIQKNGINRFSEYKYFELADITPAILELNKKYGLTTLISFTPELATLTVVDADSGDTVQFVSPMAVQAMPKNTGATEVQQLGAVQTYLRRYLYVLYLDIVEKDLADELQGEPETKKEEPKKTKIKTPKSNRPATPTERASVKKDIIDKDGEATETQIKSIKNGLKKLREKGSYEDYIKSSVMRMKAGLDKVAAEQLLVEIATKVKE